MRSRQAIPHHEIVWREHVVPATNRPLGVGLRPNTSAERRLIVQLNYSLFENLYDSRGALEIAQGKLGRLKYANCFKVRLNAYSTLSRSFDYSVRSGAGIIARAEHVGSIDRQAKQVLSVYGYGASARADLATRRLSQAELPLQGLVVNRRNPERFHVARLSITDEHLKREWIFRQPLYDHPHS